MNHLHSQELTYYVTTWAERDTAENLYSVDVATTPFSATWRSDAIDLNIVSGTVRYGTGL